MIDAVSIYINGTTKETLEEVAPKFGFSAYVLRGPENGELDVLFERDYEETPDALVNDPQHAADAIGLLDDLGGSGCEIRFIQVFHHAGFLPVLRPMFAALDTIPTITAEVEYDSRY